MSVKNFTGPPLSWFWSLSVGNRILLFNLLFIIVSVRKGILQLLLESSPLFRSLCVFLRAGAHPFPLGIHNCAKLIADIMYLHLEKFVFKQFCICIWTILSMPSQSRWGYAAVQNCSTFQNWHLWVTCKGKSSLIWNIPLCKNLTWQKCVQDSIQSEVSIEIGGYASKKLPTLQGIHINRSSTQLTQLASLLPHKHKSQIHNMLIIAKEQFACFKLTAVEQKDPWNHLHGFLFFWIKIRI